jgi:nicotinate-nucleotide adenylyltransferase
MKIGIVGGSFDPIHKGHSLLSNYIVSQNILDALYIMPCYKSLYNKELSSSEHRLNMLNLAELHKNCIPFSWEIDNKIENVGTYDIMLILTKIFKLDQLYFIIGQDNAEKINTWKNSDKILNDIKFLVVPRKKYKNHQQWYLNHPHIFLKNYPENDFSSTNIKTIINNTEELKKYLDKNVLDYIIQHQLYKGNNHEPSRY